jgi:uncharacterized membrane protein YdbT with pleckstrin-like domain
MIEFNETENIILETRKHWLVFAVEIFILIIMALVPLLIISFLRNMIDLSFIVGNVASLFIFIYCFWLLILWIMGFMFWTDYFLDIWVITSERIIDVEQHGLFRREISVFSLDKIQDKTHEVTGLLATILNYGDVKIQTAGSNGKFCIKGIPNPAYVNAKIGEAIIMYKKNNRDEQIAQLLNFDSKA